VSSPCVGDAHSHHNHDDDDGQSSLPPPRSNAYATKLTAPTSVHVVTRTSMPASLRLVSFGAERERWRLALKSRRR